MISRKRTRKAFVEQGQFSVLEANCEEESDSSEAYGSNNGGEEENDLLSKFRKPYSSMWNETQRLTDSESENDDDQEIKYNEETKDFEESDESDDDNIVYPEEYDSCGQDRKEDYRLITYVNFALSEGLSSETLRRMDGLMETLYGFSPIFTSRDVIRVMESDKSQFLSSLSFYCNQCGEEKTAKTEDCEKCRLKYDSLNTATIVVVDAKEQLKSVLCRSGKQIIEDHGRLHKGEMTEFRSIDVRCYTGYQECLETKEEYSRKEINLVYTLSSDGARFKRLSRREVTPVFLRVECLRIEERNAMGGLILISTVFADGGVKKYLLDNFVNRSFSQLKNLALLVPVDDELWTFRLVTMSYMTDMKEQKLLTQLPNWWQELGCSQCITKGSKKRNGKITYSNSDTFPDRSNKEILRDSKSAQNGFTEPKVPTVFKFASPHCFTVDPFHVKAMGISKHILSEVLHPTKWASAKFKIYKFQSLCRALAGVKNYTYDNVPFQNVRKLSKCTGREIEKLSLYVTAVSSWTYSLESPNFNAFYLGLYNALFFTGSHLGQSRPLRELLDLLYELHVEIAPDTVTMKFHTFYKHVQNHEDKFGIMHTTESFEKEHKFFMNIVHHQSTNCEKLLAARYCSAQKILGNLKKHANLLSPRMRTAVHSSMKFPFSTITSATRQFSSAANVVPLTEITGAHKKLARQLAVSGDAVYHRRIAVSTLLGSFIFSADKYWKTRNTDQSTIAWMNRDDRSFRYGYIELIYSTNGQTHLAVSEYVLEPFSVTFQRLLEDEDLSPTASLLIDKCREFPTTFSKVDSTVYCDILSSQILSPSTIIPYDDYKLVKLHR